MDLWWQATAWLVPVRSVDWQNSRYKTRSEHKRFRCFDRQMAKETRPCRRWRSGSRRVDGDGVAMAGQSTQKSDLRYARSTFGSASVRFLRSFTRRRVATG